MNGDVLVQLGEKWHNSSWHLIEYLLETQENKMGILIFGYDTEDSRFYFDSYLEDKDIPMVCLDLEHSDRESRLRAIKTLQQQGAKDIVGLYGAPPILEIGKTLDAVKLINDAIFTKKEEVGGANAPFEIRDLLREPLTCSEKCLERAELLIADPPTTEEGFYVLVTRTYE